MEFKKGRLNMNIMMSRLYEVSMRKGFFQLLIIIYFLLIINCEKKNLSPDILQSYSNSDLSSENVEQITDKEDEQVIGNEFPIRFVLNGLHGFLNDELKIVIPPIYANGFNYTDHGYVIVSYTLEDGRGESRILDRNGNIVFREIWGNISLLYDDVISYRVKSESLNLNRVIRFRDNFLIADRLGETIKSPDGNLFVARLYETGEYIFMDFSGNRVLANLQLHMFTRGFSEGRAVVIEGNNREVRIIDINGDFYGSLQFFRAGEYFSEGLLPAETTDRRTGYINRDGEFAFFVPITSDIPNNDWSPLNATQFRNGYAIIQTVLYPSIWRVINNQGEYVSDELPILEAVHFVNDISLIRISHDELGFMNIKGELLYDKVFERADSFHKGYAIIVYNGRDGIINTDGKIYWSDEFAYIGNKE